ncbi:protein of unknown function [Nitrospira defluvii]|uniref:Uncharacterized protein n=1 Tax=Nitrospira defluvii TaxID=330214 RepID=D8PIR2_9BACT|nr:protein of unknown function [Nitrospira defluvii]
MSGLIHTILDREVSLVWSKIPKSLAIENIADRPSRRPIDDLPSTTVLCTCGSTRQSSPRRTARFHLARNEIYGREP